MAKTEIYVVTPEETVRVINKYPERFKDVDWGDHDSTDFEDVMDKLRHEGLLTCTIEWR